MFQPVNASKRSQRASDAGSSSLVDQIVEREALVTLMDSIHTALVRKDLLLNALENLDELVTNRGEALEHVRNVSVQLEAHRLWLQNGIKQTTAALDKLLVYLQLFYGKAYLPAE